MASLPLPNQPLRSRYSGLFLVLKRTIEVNYVIESPKKCKNKKHHVHMNLLKKYCERDDLKENVENVREVSFSGAH